MASPVLLRPILGRLVGIALVAGAMTALLVATAILLSTMLDLDAAPADPGARVFLSVLVAVLAIPYGMVAGAVALILSLPLWPLAQRLVRRGFRTRRGVIVATTGLCAWLSSSAIGVVFQVFNGWDDGLAATVFMPGTLMTMAVSAGLPSLIAIGLAWRIFRAE